MAGAGDEKIDGDNVFSNGLIFLFKKGNEQLAEV
jgi:hypothetical protein